MNEDEVSRLFSRADNIPLHPRPDAQTLISSGQRLLRRQRLLGAVSVAAVAALIVGAGAAWLPGSGSTTPIVGEETTAVPDDPAVPPAPDGTRWVGFNGVMVAVPSDWSLNDTVCGQPRSDTVDFDDEGHDDCAMGGAFTVVRVLALSSPVGRQWQDVAGREEEVDGTTGIRVGADGCRLSAPPQCGGLLAIPDMDAVFVVESRRSAEEVNAILDTARLVPEGFTSVPDLRGMVGDSDPETALHEARLTWESSCDEPPNPCAPQTVGATDPAAGSVVPVGTIVRAVHRERDATEALSCAPDEYVAYVDYDQSEPEPGISLDEAMARYLATATAGGLRYDVVGRTDDEAEAQVVDAEGALVAVVGLSRWDNDSWSVEGYAECKPERAPGDVDELPGTVPAESDLLGTWRLVPEDGAAPRHGHDEVTFASGNAEEETEETSGLTWRGSDGCNVMQGALTVGPAGTVRATGGITTWIACSSHGAGGPVVHSAKQLRLIDDRLFFYSDADVLGGTFARARPGDATVDQPATTEVLGPFEVTTDGPLMVHASACAGECTAMAAEVQGRLVLRDGGCLLLGGMPVVWPAGTEWDAEAEVARLPSGDVVTPGASVVRGGGGYLNAQETGVRDVPEVAEDCMGETGEIAVLNVEGDVAVSTQ